MATSNLLTDIRTNTLFTIPATWGNIGTGANEMSDTVTIAGTGSVVILILQIQLNEGNNDKTAKFRFTRGGSEITGSPILSGFLDAADESNSLCLIHALDGISGSQTFAAQAEIIANDPAVDADFFVEFQVIEITSGASIEVDQNATDTVTTPATYADIGSMVATFTPTASSLQLMIANIPLQDGIDDTALFRMAVGGTQEGPELKYSADATNEQWDTGFAHISSGNAAASTAFSVQWEIDNATPQSGNDNGKRRTFQVVEITANFSLQTDLISTASENDPNTYADMSGLSDAAIAIDSTDSVVFCLAAGCLTYGTDNAVKFRFADAGTGIGAEQIWFTDATTHGGSFCLAHGLTGKSGSAVDLAVQWENVANSSSTDTALERSFQVLDLKNAPVGGITRAPGLGTGTFAGVVPVIATGVQVSVGNATFIGLAPTLQFGFVIEVPVGSLTISGFAPTVEESHVALPGVGNATFAGFIPVVAREDNHIRGPPLGTGTFTGLVPTVNITIVRLPGVGSGIFSGLSPSVEITHVREPATGSASFVGLQPTVQSGGDVVRGPNTGTLTLTGFVPTVRIDFIEAPGVGSGIFSGLIPSVEISHVAVPATGSGVFTGLSPTVEVSHIAVPGVGNATFAGAIPLVVLSSGSSVIAVPAGSLTVTGNIPSVIVIEILADSHTVSFSSQTHSMTFVSTARRTTFVSASNATITIKDTPVPLGFILTEDGDNIVQENGTLNIAQE